MLPYWPRPLLSEDNVPFRLVVEPQEREAYAAEFGADRLLILPFSNLGLGGIPARNWVWEHSKAAGHARHWILDDNIRQFVRRRAALTPLPRSVVTRLAGSGTFRGNLDSFNPEDDP